MIKEFIRKWLELDQVQHTYVEYIDRDLVNEVISQYDSLQTKTNSLIRQNEQLTLMYRDLVNQEWVIDIKRK